MIVDVMERIENDITITAGKNSNMGESSIQRAHSKS